MLQPFEEYGALIFVIEEAPTLVLLEAQTGSSAFQTSKGRAVQTSWLLRLKSLVAEPHIAQM